MKKNLLGLVVAMLVVPATLADTITVYDGPGSPGGLFNVVTTGNGSFATFCLEASEYLNIGGTYYYTISTDAKYNGDTTPPLTTDPISRGTAWLYRNYTTAVAGYVNDALHNNAIQNAIWWFESEGGAQNDYTLAAQNADALWANDANGAYGVYVMNLWANADGTGPKQDLLLRVPDGGLTAMLLGMGVLGLGWVRRIVK